MKKIGALALLVAALLAFGLASCGSSLAEEDVKNATAVSYASWMTSALASAFGEAPEGVSVSEDQTTVTLDGLDISEFEMGYTSVSGTVVTSEDQSSVAFDMTMEGGPVKSIAYELSSDDINSSNFDVMVTANKKDYEVSLSEADFQ
jgi:hypothetical protein